MKNPEANHKAVECVLKVTKQGLFWTDRETYFKNQKCSLWKHPDCYLSVRVFQSSKTCRTDYSKASF